MKRGIGNRHGVRAVVFVFFLFFFYPIAAGAAEEYSFDVEEFTAKPYEWGGYAEIRFEHLNLNEDSASYLLNFSENPRSTVDRYAGALQLEATYKKGITAFNGILRAEADRDSMGSTDNVDLYEANLSLKPNSNFTFDIGKKTFKWGKGYAWNPVAFIDRVKDPNNPDDAMEGYVSAGGDWIKSMEGPLQTVAVTAVALPVFNDINEDFGQLNELNAGAKLYLLYRDTDIDLVLFDGDSRSTRYGIDFSKNLAENIEIHGEFSRIHDVNRQLISDTGAIVRETETVEKYLIGLRYLTENDITTIIEYYYNGAGYSESERQRYYRLVKDAASKKENNGGDTLFRMAENLSRSGYGSPQAGRNYLYLRITQKDPLDILYLTPGLTAIYNVDDQSCSLTPEIVYKGFTDWELRLRYSHLIGDDETEFGEKQNRNKVEFRVRYFF